MFGASRLYQCQDGLWVKETTMCGFTLPESANRSFSSDNRKRPSAPFNTSSNPKVLTALTLGKLAWEKLKHLTMSRFDLT